MAQEQRVVVIPAFYTQDENNIHHGGTGQEEDRLIARDRVIGRSEKEIAKIAGIAKTAKIENQELTAETRRRGEEGPFTADRRG